MQLHQTFRSFRRLAVRAIVCWELVVFFLLFYELRYGANPDIVHRVGTVLLDLSLTIAVVTAAIYIVAVVPGGAAEEWERFREQREVGAKYGWEQ